jgi:hypothetical protein
MDIVGLSLMPHFKYFMVLLMARLAVDETRQLNWQARHGQASSGDISVAVNVPYANLTTE